MLFSEKHQSSMQQEDKIKCVLICEKNVPKGYMDFMSYTFLQQYGEYLVKFNSHWMEPKLGAAIYVSKCTSYDWS
jgi:hypothetical protein